MTTKCPSCQFDTICPPLFKQKAEAKPELCSEYREDTGVMSGRNWT